MSETAPTDEWDFNVLEGGLSEYGDLCAFTFPDATLAPAPRSTVQDRPASAGVRSCCLIALSRIYSTTEGQYLHAFMPSKVGSPRMRCSGYLKSLAANRRLSPILPQLSSSP